MATAQDVIDRARELINDVASDFVSGLRWSDSELLQWLTDGQREIVMLKPEANAVTDWFPVEGGFPRQRLDPTIAYRLIRVEANGAGTTPIVEDPAPQAIFISGLGEGTSGGYSDPEVNGAGTLLESTFVDPVFLLLDSYSDSGGTVRLMLRGTSSAPPQDVYTSIQIYDADQNLLAELDLIDAAYESAAFEPVDSMWTWTNVTDIFSGQSGKQFTVVATL